MHESHVLRYAIQNESFLLQLYNAGLINGFLNTIHYRRRIIKSAATIANKHRITVLNFQRQKYDQSISMVIHAVICCALNIFYVSFNLINNERPSASVSHFTHFFVLFSQGFFFFQLLILEVATANHLLSCPTLSLAIFNSAPSGSASCIFLSTMIANHAT